MNASSNNNNGATISAAASAKAIDGLIKKVVEYQGKFRDKVQEAALAIMVHARDFDDCSKAKDLCRAVNSRERNSLIGYFLMFSPIGVVIGQSPAEDRSRFVEKNPVNPDHNKETRSFDIEGAKVSLWHDDPGKLNPEPKPLGKLLDFYTTVDNLLKKAIADADKTDEKAKYEAEYREEIKADAAELREMVARFQAKQMAARASSGSAEPTTTTEATNDAGAGDSDGTNVVEHLPVGQAAA